MMIIKILLPVLVAFSFLGSAQITKGRVLIGAGLNLSVKTQTETGRSAGIDAVVSKTTDWSSGQNARVGCFVSKHMMVGLFGLYTVAKYELKDTYNTIYRNPAETTKNDLSMISLGAFARFYQLLGKSRLAVFAELGAHYGKGKTSFSSVGASPPMISSGNFTTTRGYFNPGITYFFKRHFAIEAAFGQMAYSFQTSTSDQNNNIVVKGRSSKFESTPFLSFESLFIGLNFYFGGKKEKVVEEPKPENISK